MNLFELIIQIITLKILTGNEIFSNSVMNQHQIEGFCPKIMKNQTTNLIFSDQLCHLRKKKRSELIQMLQETVGLQSHAHLLPHRIPKIDQNFRSNFVSI